ncbi:hypothetical protein AAFF_G00412690 [Aldrovandia affinis]|uniref:SH3 domain-containing protein n=1 Tax=Aldrovandia affinis TaxID=143900 RepID=A0AAD7SD91_9TELE|nr:hypothetical protein AAFF_G00412690 [Aldrovandia affinis]
MAEARLDEEEESPREPVVLRNRRGQSTAATDRSERNKPERRLSSLGALSSLRAAIKRTSTRTSSPGDRPRDRRRPEITILSAEPLASNTWFPGVSGGFPAAPPPAQPIWGGNIPASPSAVVELQSSLIYQPPPSYDQVIKEKTQEQSPPPSAIAATRHSTTIATQTDLPPDPGATHPECTAAPRYTEKAVSAVRKPTKPPRPSLPCLPKPEPGDDAIVVERSCPIPAPAQAVQADTSSQTNHQAAEAQLRLPDPGCANQSAPSPPSPGQCDEPTEPSDAPGRRHVSVDRPSRATEAESASPQPQRPTPRPRSRPGKPLTAREVKVQTLVRIKDDGDTPQPLPSLGGLPAGKYLQELLDVFSADDQCCQGDPSEEADPSDRSDPGDQSEEADPNDQAETSDQSEEDDMSVSHSHRNIKGKIQAFEQSGADAGDEAPLVRPEPRPRTQHTKPPAVAAKPAFARRPSALWEQPVPGMASGLDNDRKEAPPAPTPKPRPLHARVSFEVESRDAARRRWRRSRSSPRPLCWPGPRASGPRRRSLLSAGPRPHPNSNPSWTPSPTTPLPLPPPNPAENGNAERPVGHVPVKPQRSVPPATNPPSVARKPTMIRVPSRTEKVCENERLDPPPPLPVQKPIGGAPFPVIRKPSLVTRPSFPPPVEPSNPEGFSSSMPEISLPPRPVGGKVLPPPPPTAAKGAPGRPPPPRAEGPRPPSSQPGQGAVLPRRSQSQKGPVRKGPVLPPRPKPGHPLYNTYTLGIPHAIADYDYNGSNTAELSFQKKEVLVLLEQIDSNTFECQRPRLVNSPALSSCVSSEREQRTAGASTARFHSREPRGAGPEGGDLVSMVEWVDSEWCRGTCRGSAGIFPVSYVRVLSTVPAPPNGPKAPPAPATVSGPRCVARFEFEGEKSDELSFSEGDVIRLKEYIGEDWARGQINASVGIFPLNFVEIVEDLPPPTPAPTTQPAAQMKIALPGMASASTPPNHVAAKPTQFQPKSAGAEWGQAQYDFTAQTEEDLSFQQGAIIQITESVDSEWSRGRLDDREGYFPAAFVEACAAPPSETETPRSVDEGRARATYDFLSEEEDELSLKAGDIITGLETVDDDWFLGDLRGTSSLRCAGLDLERASLLEFPPPTTTRRHGTAPRATRPGCIASPRPRRLPGIHLDHLGGGHSPPHCACSARSLARIALSWRRRARAGR